VDRKTTAQRDAEIVAARLSGVSAAEVADAWGVSPRTVRRVKQRWATGGSPLTGREAERAIQGVVEELERLDSKLGYTENGSTRATLLLRRGSLCVRFVHLMRDAGLPLDASASLGPDPELVSEINRGIRRTLTEHGVGPGAIEDAVEAVLASIARQHPELMRSWLGYAVKPARPPAA